MSTLTAILCVMALGAGYALIQRYVTRSMRSYASADKAWKELVAQADSLLAQGLPPNLARAVVGLVGAAGCGCFVRGMLLFHYLPGALRADDGDARVAQAFSELDALSAETRKAFDNLIMRVVIYDSFRNPFQGWLFRRALHSQIETHRYKEKREVELTAYAVLSRKMPKLAVA